MDIPEKIAITAECRIEITVVEVVWRRDPDRATASTSDIVVLHNEPSAPFEAVKIRYRMNEDVPGPRRGSMNFAVWELARNLPGPFSRSQFESVVPTAMHYDAVTQQFGIQTNFPSIRRASQAYFSEFRKRRWIVEA